MVFDCAIIGGGVVGTAILNKLTRIGKKCVLLEIQNDVGFGASRANSGIIHTGFDCKPNTLKAKLNVRGFALFEPILKRLDVSYKTNGHLVIGNDLNKLNELKERGEINGVKGLEIIGDKELHTLEPNITQDIKYALYAPQGKIVSSYHLAVRFSEEAIINGAEVMLEFNTKQITKENGIFKIVSTNNQIVYAHSIVNASASGFNAINKLMKAENYNFEFRRGEYYLLDKDNNNFCTHTIFPLPTEHSKGVLITATPSGNILVGPTSYVSDTSTKTTEQGLNSIKQLAMAEMSALPLKLNIRTFSGVRCLVGDEFIIERSKKVDSLINVAGICSPGLSSAPAIAEMVCELLGYNPNQELKNLKVLPKQIRMQDLPVAKQDELIKQNNNYGKIVCKCEEISLGEIIDAIKSPLPAKSVDAIKRRTRAGMGRCQGGFCIFSVMEQLAKYNKTEFNDVLKDGVNSKIIVSEIKPEVKNNGK